MKKFGICMEGNEAAFERAIAKALAAFPEDDIFNYVEIGLATADTMKDVAALLQDSGRTWRAFGFDIPDGWSFNIDHVVANLGDLMGVIIHNPSSDFIRAYNKVTCIINSGADTLGKYWSLPIHLAFIDGCHGAPCVTADFLAVDRHAISGTIVMFHDTSPGCQGIHMQPHCKTGIDVRRALKELGLLDNKYEGWRLVEETNAPHGVTIVEKI